MNTENPALITAELFIEDYKATGEPDDLQAAIKILQREHAKASRIFAKIPEPGALIRLVVPTTPPEDDE